MILNAKNYYSDEANEYYLSASQFKDFAKCEAYALAKLRGRWLDEESEALLLGAFVDALLCGDDSEFAKFVNEHPQIFKKGKSGEFLKPFVDALATVDRIKRQPTLMKALSGQHQTIMTGEIGGVLFKIKMDSYHPDERIVDLKYMKSLQSPNLYTPMLKYWDYDVQAAVYREVVRQNTGKELPFEFCVATKERPARLALTRMDPFDMDTALNFVKANAARYRDIKLGKIKPMRCNKYACAYCAATQVITGAIDSDKLGLDGEPTEEV